MLNNQTAPTIFKIVDKILEDTDYSDSKIKADKYYVVRRDGKNLKLVTDTAYDYLQDATAAMFVWNNEHYPIVCWVKSGLEMKQDWPQSFIYESATGVKVKTPDGEGIKVGEGKRIDGSEYVTVQMPKSLGFNKPVRYKKEDVTIIESIVTEMATTLKSTLLRDHLKNVKSVKESAEEKWNSMSKEERIKTIKKYFPKNSVLNDPRNTENIGQQFLDYHSSKSFKDLASYFKKGVESVLKEMATAQGTWDSISKSGRQLFCMNNNLPEQLAYKNWIELSKELQDKISSLMILRKDLQPRVVNTK